ncbi:PREDICTED: major facilitator superfamily domain-containing protein 6-like [Eurypyga helias]|uniref:major facilitator superfamily domain-containing protein 6-like n=1 Tax=Eurypyga helias TaxID=54383 RepID=UPI00052838AC|nr:PREDICTED: major facilitator superfamily domain-containing protein 6-like [Eurypyga helias]
MSEQRDVGRILALAGRFRLLQGAGRACVTPFLTLYLRHLGLPAPLVGVVAGAKHLAAVLWAPLCSRCPQSRGKRRLLVVTSLLGSVGACLLLTLIPPADGDAGYKYCNASQQAGDRGAAATAPGPGSHADLSTSATTNAKGAWKETVKTTGDVLMASRTPAPASAAFQGLAGLRDTPEKKGRGIGDGDAKTNGCNGCSAGPSGSTPSVKAVKWEAGEPGTLAPYRPPLHGLEKERSSLRSAATDLAERKEMSWFKATLPTAGGADMPGKLPDHWKEAVKNLFQDREHRIFLMVLATVVLWELLATSFEQMVDESLYEYLDSVDATDRCGKLWIWSYLGASVGACSIAASVDQLNCFLSGTITRLAVHFYGHAALVTLSLLVSVFFPVHVPKKSNHVNKTAKALALLRSDGQAILYAITLFLTGAAGSAVQNFLFWQMQDRGSRELCMGLTVAAGLLAELLLHCLQGTLLRTFLSSKVVAVSLSLLAVELLSYSFLWAEWAALLVQVLAAFSSSALWRVVNRLGGDTATAGMERPLHAVPQGLCYGGGASVGSFAGGFVVKRFGLAVLYRACSVCLLLWLCLFSIVQSKLPRQKKVHYSCLLAAGCSDRRDSDEDDESLWLVTVMRDESFLRNWSQPHGIY